MKVEVSEREMQEYADKRMKERINKIVEVRLGAIDWYKRVDQTVFSVVEKQITPNRCNKIISELDRQLLIDSIAKHLAERIMDRLVDGH